MIIMFITPSLSTGGAEHVVARLSSAFAEQHEVHVVCTWPEGNDRGMYPIADLVHVHEIKPIFPVRPRNGADAYFMEHWSVARQLRYLKQSLDVDVSISVLTPCNYDNVRSRRGEVVVTSIRNILEPALDEERISAKRMKKIISRSGKKSDSVVCVSRNVEREQVDVFDVPAEKLHVIYNPIDLAGLANDATEVTADDEFESFAWKHDQLVATMGRFVPQKGHRHLIRAFAHARKCGSDAGLVLLGRGPLESELRASAQALGIADHVFFAGFKTNPVPYLAQVDAFVLCSRREGFSNALLEACGCGLPIIATDCNSGPRELLAPSSDPQIQAEGVEFAEYGLLVPVCDNDVQIDSPLDDAECCLADAILQLLDDSALRSQYAKLARERAAAFSMDAILRKWENLISALVAERARR